MKLHLESLTQALHRLVAAGLLLGALMAPLGAQIGLSVQNESGYTSNAFANYYAAPDYFTSTTAGIHYDWLRESSGNRLYYEGEWILFNDYRDRNAQQHEAGLKGYQLLEDSGHRIDWGIRLQTLRYAETYRWYEQNRASAYAQLKYVAQPFWFIYAGINLTHIDYPRLTPFAHFRVHGFIRNSWFLDTGTTLICETGLLQKSYSQLDQPRTALDAPEIVYGTPGSSLQGTLALRAAQAVTARSGLSLEYRVRHNFSNASRYLASAEGGYFSDEDLFEDIFAHHGQSLAATYKQRLPWLMQFSVNGQWAGKQYDERLAADLTGVIFEDGRLRSDTRRALWLEVEKQIRLTAALAPLKLSLTLSQVKNHSNDPFYNYTSGYWGVQFQQGF